MYFSHNVTYYGRQIDPHSRKKGMEFIPSDQMSVIQESKKRYEEEQKSKIDDFLEENFTQEEIEFLKNNWTPPTF